MWVRIAAHYDVWYEPQLLAAYRRHDESTTGRNTRNARELHYSRMAIKMFEPLLPRERKRDIVRRAKFVNARTALDNAKAYARERDWPGVTANLLMALRLRPRAATLRQAAAILVGTNRD
jgi:hypothetical protein